MRVILSVFECNPYAGSDAYVGWSYVINMARLNEVYAITRVENKQDIERYYSEKGNSFPKNLHFVYIKRERFFAEKLYKINRYLGFLGSYYVWQKAAYKMAKEICLETDISVCHHVSIADFRCAGYMWKLNKPFIFGPVGGAQETPECLSCYTKGYKKEEIFRYLMNRLLILLPNYRKALKRAAVVYSSNDETTARLVRNLQIPDRWKVTQLTELCIEDNYVLARAGLKREDKDTVHVIVSGRLIYRKGVELLLDAVKEINTDRKYIVDIYGDGEQREKLAQKIEKYEIGSNVIIHGKVSFEEMQKRYREADIYVLPSLRETTGTAVLEAMANKLPVVALNQNGVKHIVTDQCGILIDIESREQVIKDFAKALTMLIENHELRWRLGETGYQLIRDSFSWTQRAIMMDGVYRQLCSKE